MAAEGLVRRDVVDDHRPAALPDLVADRGLDLELAAGLEPELDLVAHLAGDPAVLADPRHRGKAHAGRAAHDLENRGHDVDPRDRRDLPISVQ